MLLNFYQGLPKNISSSLFFSLKFDIVKGIARSTVNRNLFFAKFGANLSKLGSFAD